MTRTKPVIQRTSPRVYAWLRVQAVAGALAVGLVASPNQTSAQAIIDAHFREAYFREYKALDGVAGDMVVMELRDRVELIAGGGSHVGAASNQRRVRGFESALLGGLQAAICRGAQAGQARPSSTVVEKVGAAASTQGLSPQPVDVAELSAMAQRLLDNQSSQRWCSLSSLDDIR